MKKIILLIGIVMISLVGCSSQERIITGSEMTCYSASYCYNHKGGCLNYIEKYRLNKWDCYERCPTDIPKESLLIIAITKCHQENVYLEELQK